MSFTNAKNKYCAWQYPTNASYRNAKKFSDKWFHYMGESKVLSELSYYQDFTENIFKTKIETKPKLIFTNKIEGEAKKNNIGLVIGGAIISR